MTDAALAIDLGTSNTVAALRRPDGRTEQVSSAVQIECLRLARNASGWSRDETGGAHQARRVPGPDTGPYGIDDETPMSSVGEMLRRCWRRDRGSGTAVGVR
ncbi:hypothetical protein GCM10022220_43600 [Actinocatenispora rupis]|uniref:Hsp70 protein n=1 Tax=Actinocatenispora rupis TaxID=519421 RepID=A0A8J3NGI0_9ACTN|nr:hypothetical protein Aru02nite_57830 [Actinocatenispora rupis]